MFSCIPVSLFWLCSFSDCNLFHNIAHFYENLIRGPNCMIHISWHYNFIAFYFNSSLPPSLSSVCCCFFSMFKKQSYPFLRYKVNMIYLSMDLTLFSISNCCHNVFFYVNKGYICWLFFHFFCDYSNYCSWYLYQIWRNNLTLLVWHPSRVCVFSKVGLVAWFSNLVMPSLVYCIKLSATKWVFFIREVLLMTYHKFTDLIYMSIFIKWTTSSCDSS